MILLTQLAKRGMMRVALCFVNSLSVFVNPLGFLSAPDPGHILANKLQCCDINSKICTLGSGLNDTQYSSLTWIPENLLTERSYPCI
jgi:hypothetical protein